MYDWPYTEVTYARCRVNKTRWFWVVFETWEDRILDQSDIYGYEKTAVAAEARARLAAGPGASKTAPGDAVSFLWALRHGNLYRRGIALPPWCVTLGLELPCGIDEVKAAYRRLAKLSHPDAGGKAEDFVAIESAYRDALAYCQRTRSPLAS